MMSSQLKDEGGASTGSAETISSGLTTNGSGSGGVEAKEAAAAAEAQDEADLNGARSAPQLPQTEPSEVGADVL